MPERIDLTQAEDPRDVIHRAVACLARGGVVGVPTGSGYALMVGLLQPAGVAKVSALHRGDVPHLRTARASLLLRSLDEMTDWVIVPSEAGRKLARRVWPGPVVLEFPILPEGLADRIGPEIRAWITVEGRLPLSISADRPTREILRLSSGPLALVDVAHSDPTRRRDYSASWVDSAGLDETDLVLEVGPLTPGMPPTVVALVERPPGWMVTRSGAMSERAVAEWAGTIVLFICTGNTCRSPMAEALCKVLLAERLGCAPDDLIDRGFVVLSAGISAAEGMPAAANALAIVEARGGSLAEHSSRQASPDLVRHADHILAMTLDHLDFLVDQVPEAADRARLLDPRGDDIPDPVGMDYSTYAQTAREIERHLAGLMTELGV